jgi:hypothetical protein
MKKPAPKPTPRAPMSLDDMTREIAAGLKDVINETDSAYLERDPEEAFTDLAYKFIVRLQVANLTIVPSTTAERIRIGQAKAASRVFAILTKWMHASPGRSYDTRVSDSGKFQIVVKTPDACQRTRLFFGDDIQDAYAQAAQTICFDGGTL